MVLPWCCHGVVMVLSWCCHGVVMLLPWCCHGVFIVLPCCYHVVAMVLSCCWHGVVMLLSWCCHVAMVTCTRAGEPQHMMSLALDPPDLCRMYESTLLLEECGALLRPKNSREPFSGTITFLGKFKCGVYPINLNGQWFLKFSASSFPF